MELINLIVYILSINLILNKLNAFKHLSNVLGCGLVGFCGQHPPSINKLQLLGSYNVSRGKDSCGILINNDIYYGINQNKEFQNFIAKNQLDPKFNKNNTVIIHTRKSSVGFVNEDNAHPFGYTDSDEDALSFAGAHNGTISNWKDLLTEYNIDPSEFNVDSDALLFIIYSQQNYEVLSKYKGYASLLFSDINDPNSLYVFRGAAGGQEERPLYYIRSKEGVYFSSIKESLSIIENHNADPLEVPANVVLKYKNGRLVKRIPIERTDDKHGKLNNRHYNYNHNTKTYNHQNYGQQNHNTGNQAHLFNDQIPKYIHELFSNSWPKMRFSMNLYYNRVEKYETIIEKGTGLKNLIIDLGDDFTYCNFRILKDFELYTGQLPNTLSDSKFRGIYAYKGYPIDDVNHFNQLKKLQAQPAFHYAVLNKSKIITFESLLDDQASVVGIDLDAINVELTGNYTAIRKYEFISADNQKYTISIQGIALKSVEVESIEVNIDEDQLGLISEGYSIIERVSKINNEMHNFLFENFANIELSVDPKVKEILKLMADFSAEIDKQKDLVDTKILDLETILKTLSNNESN